MSENLRKITRAVYGFDAVARRVADDQLDNPSPCEGWTGRDVLRHNVNMMDMMRATALGDDPPAMDHLPELVDPQQQWADARDAFLASLDQEGVLARVQPTIWGEMSVDDFIGLMAVDTLCHTWDLAQTAGLEAHLDPALCEAGIAQLEQAGDMLRGAGLFGAVTDSSGSTPEQRLIAISGRTPL